MSPGFQVLRDLGTEPGRSTANGLVADLDPAGGEKLFDVPQAQAETKVQPHSMADHLRREAVALE